MKKNIPTSQATYTCRQCSHARLMQTALHNPVLAQCRIKKERYYPMFSHSQYEVACASTPACTLFSITHTERTPELVSVVR